MNEPSNPARPDAATWAKELESVLVGSCNWRTVYLGHETRMAEVTPITMTNMARAVAEKALTLHAQAVAAGAQQLKGETERTQIVYEAKNHWQARALNAEQRVAQAVREEQEACAKESELDSVLDWVGGSTGNAKGTAIRIAQAIRARGPQEGKA